VDNGDEERVLQMRAAFQSPMATECRAAVEDLTGRKVIAFMSANHVEPDMAADRAGLSGVSPARGRLPKPR
jgi:hypothetical protein